MASDDLHDSLQLLWVEIYDVSTRNTDAEVDEFEVSVKESPKEMAKFKLEETKDEKDDVKHGKKPESESTQLHERNSKEKCVAFSKETIVVSHHSKIWSEIKAKVKDLKFIPRDSSKKSRDPSPQKKQNEKEIPVSSLIESAKDGPIFEYPLEDMNVTLHVRLNSIGSLSVARLDDSWSDEVYNKLKESSLASDTLGALKEFASKLEENLHSDLLDKVVETVKGVAKAHPILSIAVNALSAPYEMWKQEREFKDNLKALARDMCTSLEAMIEAYPSIESKHAKEIVTKLVRFILQASAYVESFSNKGEFTEEKEYPRFGRIKQFIKAQFPKKLDDYRSDLRDSRLDFREAVLVDVLIKSGEMNNRADMSFLRDKLKPSEQLPMDKEWLENSRAKVMTRVDTWLKSDDVPKVGPAHTVPLSRETTFWNSA